MDITCIPYHDWRKIQKEGSRTRDAHVISHLYKHKSVDRVLVINRPTTLTEILLNKKGLKMDGTLVFKTGNCYLYKINDKLYVLDYLSNDLFGPIFKGKGWFFKSFGDKKLHEGYLSALKFLDFKDDYILTQNVFSANFIKAFADKRSIFDAWDNFLLFPENKKFESEFRDAYKTLAIYSDEWITNSAKNIDFYNEHYSPKACTLIKNGVDIDVFTKTYDKPEDLSKIKGPIIGFGGKITHLFNYDLFNYVTKENKDKNFVIVGQILDKSVFEKIDLTDNVFYLGDKNYSVYPKYVTNFNVGIVPYVTNDLEHGADSIKVYEYLAAGLNVVGTSGAGMQDMSSYISVAQNKEEFSKAVQIGVSRHSSRYDVS